MKNISDRVNLECDIIGKYVERMMSFKIAAPSESRITMDFLSEKGFI